MHSRSDPVGALPLVTEAARIALARPVLTGLIGAIVAGVCIAILLTTGQTVTAEDRVLSRIDEVGTRSIVVSDQQGTAVLSPDAVERVAAIDGVQWVIGLGYASDGQNAQLAGGGTRVALRTLYGNLPSDLVTINGRAPLGAEALAGTNAIELLGMRNGVGGLDVGDTQYAVVGTITSQGPLDFLNTGLIGVPGDDTEDEQLRSIHLVVEDPALVAPVTEAVRQVLGAADPLSVSIETSATLAELRAAVSGELGRFGHNLVIFVLAAGLVLVGLTIFGSVTLQRQDFGRRRALGATRTTVVILVTAQTMLTAVAGAFVGSAIAVGISLARDGATPGFEFVAAISILAVLATGLAALFPALIAAHRDPVRVLRVP